MYNELLMVIDLDEVQHVAKLARLELSNEELLAFQGELNALIGHFHDLDGIDLSNIAPKPHAVPLKNVWSDDEIHASLTREEALANGPVTRAGLFIVPTIIGD